ncbi:MAG: hypothetical protein JSU85_04805 [Candidatus Zixiibacteriota bacterium]|nr:MAG: hypothetical protein JSU85_04805 [candidate division Zixibacteria bacterium]
MGLTPEHDVRFKISDKDEICIYEEPLTLPYIEEDDYDPNFPRLHPPDTMIIIWDGRQNTGENDGHLADPENDSYNAWVEVNMLTLDVLSSNVEEFDIMPTIDSVLVTHYPWYPPPRLKDGIDIFSLIRAKIDDSGVSEDDYRYYIPKGEILPSEATFWDGEHYRYWDLPAEWGQVYYYRDLEAFSPYPVNNWDNAKWGDISYKWYWVDDYARSGGYSSIWWQQDYYNDYDMTFIWGSDWRFYLHGEIDWQDPEVNAELRFLIRSRVINFKNEHLLQDVISAEKSKAHLVITGPTNEPIENWDIRDWAVTQMGTPYYTFGRDPYPQMGKRPYIFNDCSSLVISARIQDISVEQNEWYRLNHIGVAHVVENYYPYPPPDGDHVPLGLTEITEAEAEPNDIIILAKKLKPFSHVVIINDVNKLNGRISRAIIIHAKGGNERDKRQTRIDYLLHTYSRRKHDYKFMRFDVH